MKRALALAALVGCAPPVGREPAAPKPRPTSAAAATVPRTQQPGLPPTIDSLRLERDLRFVAAPRPPGSRHHRRVRSLCRDTFSEAGFEVEEQVFDTGVNVIGRKAGVSAEAVVLSAHYDHIPGCSGADDNATGVAAVLEAARLLGPRQHRRSLVLACWDDEERGLNGSRAYALRARERDEPIAVAISLDGIGVATAAPGSQTLPPGFAGLFPERVAALEAGGMRADFIAFVGDTPSEPMLRALDTEAARIDLKTQTIVIGLIAKLALRDTHRSDHASFWLAGYPALIVSDSAEFRYPRYHCGAGDDAVSQIALPFFGKVAQAVIAATDVALEPEALQTPGVESRPRG